MGVKTRAIETLLASDPVTRSPTIVRSWLEAILLSDEGTNSGNREFSSMGALGYYTKYDIARTFGLTHGTVLLTIQRLGIVQVRHGHNKMISASDRELVEADLRSRGHVPLDEQDVPARSRS